MVARRWSEATRTLEAAARIRGDSIEVHRLTAVAATWTRRPRIARASLEILRAETPATGPSLVALGTASLVQSDYRCADAHARRALELEPDNAEAWGVLAASFAGLGWFDQSAACLDRATALGADPDEQVGRAVNRWAVQNTFASSIAVGLMFFIGLLALAVGFTVPFLVRELRISRLDDRFAVLAAATWRHERTLRLRHAAGVLTALLGWLAVVGIT